jgi:hypothetical protein
MSTLKTDIPAQRHAADRQTRPALTGAPFFCALGSAHQMIKSQSRQAAISQLKGRASSRTALHLVSRGGLCRSGPAAGREAGPPKLAKTPSVSQPTLLHCRHV